MYRAIGEFSTPALEAADVYKFNWVHMNVVPRSTINTNGGTEN